MVLLGAGRGSEVPSNTSVQCSFHDHNQIGLFAICSSIINVTHLLARLYDQPRLFIVSKAGTTVLANIIVQ